MKKINRKIGVLAVFILVILAFSMTFFINQAHATGLAVDWTVSGSSGTHGAPTLTLPAVSANELIVVIYAQDSSHTFAPSDTDGLTWTQHGSPVGASTMYLQEFYATTTSALSSGDVITSGESGSTAHNTIAIAFGISGANTVSPFDPAYVSVPKTLTGTTGAISLSGFATTNHDDLILGLVRLLGN